MAGTLLELSDNNLQNLLYKAFCHLVVDPPHPTCYQKRHPVSLLLPLADPDRHCDHDGAEPVPADGAGDEPRPDRRRAKGPPRRRGTPQAVAHTADKRRPQERPGQGGGEIPLNTGKQQWIAQGNKIS